MPRLPLLSWTPTRSRILSDKTFLGLSCYFLQLLRRQSPCSPAPAVPSAFPAVKPANFHVPRNIEYLAVYIPVGYFPQQAMHSIHEAIFGGSQKMLCSACHHPSTLLCDLQPYLYDVSCSLTALFRPKDQYQLDAAPDSMQMALN